MLKIRIEMVNQETNAFVMAVADIPETKVNIQKLERSITQGYQMLSWYLID
jgi:hypothetical protein